MKRRILSLILALAVIFSAVPMAAAAETKITVATVKLPEVKVEHLTDPHVTIGASYSFGIEGWSQEEIDAMLAMYGEYFVDIELTFNKDVTLSADENDEADGYLAGRFDNWLGGQWVDVPLDPVTLGANEPLLLMDYAGANIHWGLRQRAWEIAEKIGYDTFDCGVYLTDEYIDANRDLEITIKMKLYDPNPGYNSSSDPTVCPYDKATEQTLSTDIFTLPQEEKIAVSYYDNGGSWIRNGGEKRYSKDSLGFDSEKLLNAAAPKAPLGYTGEVIGWALEPGQDVPTLTAEEMGSKYHSTTIQWLLDNGYITEDNIEVASDGKMSLKFYAVYAPADVTVRWWNNDGSERIFKVTKKYHGETVGMTNPDGNLIKAAEAAAPEGHSFAGWAFEAGVEETVEVPRNSYTPKALVDELGAVLYKDDADGKLYIDIYAVYEVNQYTIDFENTGDTEIAPITQDYGTAINAPADPTKEGYTFAGWEPELPNTMPAENMTVEALWTANEYTVEFDANGGYGEMDPQSFTYDVTQNLTPNAFKRNGYQFAGWNTAADGSGDSYGDKAGVENLAFEDDATVTLYAQWEKATITFTVDPNGGQFSDGSEDPIEDSAEYLSRYTLPVITREGYSIFRWMVDELPASNVDTDILFIGDWNGLTIYPEWTPNQYTITFNTDGGSAVAPITADYLSTVEAPTAPTKENHEFLGWFDAEGNKVTFPLTMPLDGMELTAKWKLMVGNVHIYIYNSSDLTTPVAQAKIDTMVGDVIDLSTLKIEDYYSSTYGFEMVGGWFNDGRFNEYVAGKNPAGMETMEVTGAWQNIKAVVTDKAPVFINVYRDGKTDEPAVSVNLGNFLKGTSFKDIVATVDMDAIYTPYKAAVGYEWDGIWSQEISNYPADHTDRTVNGWTNLCTMVYDQYQVRYYVDGEQLPVEDGDIVTARDYQEYVLRTYTPDEDFIFNGWYQTTNDFASENKKVESLYMAKDWKLYGETIRVRFPLADAEITAEDTVYNGEAQDTVVVKYNDETLTAGVHYEISFNDNVNAGTVTATITGIEPYYGERTATFEIAKADATVELIAPASGLYTGEAYEATYKVYGVDGEEISNPDVALQYYGLDAEGKPDKSTTTEEAPVNAGAYAVAVYFRGNEIGSKVKNYNAKFEGYEYFNIEKAAPVVEVKVENAVYDGNEHGIKSMTVTGVDGEEITDYSAHVQYYKGIGDAKVAMEGVPVDAGDYTVAVYVRETANHTAKWDGWYTYTIAKAEPTIAVEVADTVYNGSEQGIVGMTVTGADGKEITDYSAHVQYYKGTGDAKVAMEGIPVDAGDYTVAVYVRETANHTAKWAGWFEYNINKKAATITADNASKTYGEEDPAEFTATVEGAVEGETLNYTVAREAGEDAGEYAIIVTVGENPNYDITPVNGVFTINKKAATITAVDASKTYGEADPAEFTATVEGAVEGETLNYTVAREAGEDAGKYAIIVTVGENPNYDITTVDGEFEILPAPIEVTAYSYSKLYGKADPKFAWKITKGKLLNGFVPSGELSCVHKNVPGTYPITQGTLDFGGNYAVTFKEGTLTIKLAPGQNLLEENKCKEPFIDVEENDWFHDDVEYVYVNGIMNGVSADEFAPNGLVNRAMVVTTLWRLEGSPEVANAPAFTDVAGSEWYAKAVAWAAAKGIVNGMGDGTFAPLDAVTREQVAAMLNRFADYKGWKVEAKDTEAYIHSAWSAANVDWADTVGLFDDLGVNVTDLTKSANRAELAAYLTRFMENVAK